MLIKIIQGTVAATLSLAVAMPLAAQEQEQEEKPAVEISRETTKISVQLVPVGERQVSGTAVILPVEEIDSQRIRPVQVELMGLSSEGAEASYPVRLFRGQCETGGTPIGEIGSVAASGGGGAAGELKITEQDWERAAERAEAEEEHAEEHAELAEEKRELEEEHAEEHAEDEDYAEAGLRQNPPLFLQIQTADGTPIACANLDSDAGLFVPGS